MTGRTTFHEVMQGTIRLAGAEAARPARLELTVEAPGVLTPWSDVEAAVSGTVRVPGWAEGPASGHMRIAPLRARRIRYRLDFATSDGRRLHLDGWKSITPRHPLRSMTVLPATIADDSGSIAGEALLRFDLRRDLIRFLAGFRYHQSVKTREGSPA